MTPHDITRLLEVGIAELGLSLPAEAPTKLCGYIGVLQQWNLKYNLTAVRKPEEMVSRHVLDSLAVAPWVQGARVLDVGTGAGLPGIPLAVAFPERHFTLLDSHGKKTRFVVHVATTLGLRNVEVVQARVEDYRAPDPFDTVITRAFAALADFLAVSAHLGGPGSRWLAMKGAPSESELRELPPGFQLAAVHALKVPGLDAQRCVVEVRKHVLRSGC
ncbi:MAG TPA: 16S rRNA (guanine(527)-N(7))-methyltransferase RsmG [Gammaproteobacteria bacterium]|nr:16S rRNA (guanine(527)-N(7))-methyltransferase RsmG [Gammaproteobacteria bacterium]